MTHDERQQLSDRIASLDQIVLNGLQERVFEHLLYGLMILSVAGGIGAWFTVGLVSTWTFYAAGLLLATLTTLVLYRVGQFLVATYLLVIELLFLVAALFMRTDILFIPYFFIPVVIISGLILSPLDTIVVALIATYTTFVMAAFTLDLATMNLAALLPPCGLILVSALLMTEARRYMDQLNERLLENKRLLHQRVWELREAQRRTDNLRERIAELSQTQSVPTGNESGLYDLIQGAFAEIKEVTASLEDALDMVSVQSNDTLDTMWQKLYQLTGLVVNLEEMARLESNQLLLNYETVDIPRLIAEVVSAARGLIQAKDRLEIRYTILEEVADIQADPARIRQVLLHLLHNAIKYTDEGVIELQAELTNKNELMIFISDTGIGMHREETELIFQKFGRGSGTLARQRQGAGLGLAICKQLVELHGGRMWVNSVLGVGSTFYIALPLKPTLSFPILEETRPDEEQRLAAAPPLPNIPEITDRPESSRLRQVTLSVIGVLLLAIQVIAVLSMWNGSLLPRQTPAPLALEARLTSTPTPTPQPSPSLTATTTPLPTATATPPPTLTATPRPTATPPPTPTISPSPTPTTASSPTPTISPTPTQIFTPTPLPRLSFSDRQIERGSWSATGQLVLSATTDGDRDIYLAGEANRSPQPLTTAAGDDIQPVWSPNGRRIVFSSGRSGNFDIYVMEADGSNLTRLTDSRGFDEWPVWSPDGRRIAFVSDRDGNTEIYVMAADGSHQQRLTHHPAEDWPVSWSPAGDRLLFSSRRDGNWNLYLISAEGGQPVRLTNDPANERDPIWGPDGRTVAFAYDGGGNWDIYTLSVPAELSAEIPRRRWTQITATDSDERHPLWRP